MLYTLAPQLLLGWPRPNRPAEREFLLPDVGARPQVGRLTGRGNTANLEVVLALKPDLILDYGYISPTFTSLADRVQEQTGIPYALLDGRFDAIAQSYRTLGALIGRRDDAEALARYAEETVGTITGRIAAIPRDKRPRVYYARGPRGLETGLGGSINVETIEMLAQNVAGGTRGGLANVSIEQVLLWDPQVIVTIDLDFAASVLTDPAWASVAAVRARRVHLSPKLPFGWVDFPPSVNRLIGLRWLANILYPDLFHDDMRARTRDFYTRFYHVTPNDEEIDRVLAGRD
jgi:iron complex transport system substrate-binding protein